MGSGGFRRKAVKWEGATFAMLFFALYMAYSPSPRYRAALPDRRELPFVQISAISVEPKEIDLSKKHQDLVAVVTVSIFHLPVATPQTVRFNVGTYSTSPPTGVTATYAPPSQTVTVPAGPSGAVVAKARVVHVDIGSNSQAKLTIAATLTNPSPGVRIEQPLSPENYRALLKVRNSASSEAVCWHPVAQSCFVTLRFVCRK